VTSLDSAIAESFPPPPSWWPEVASRSDLVTATIFPYFGGKSKIAGLVWERFGNVVNYVEPYAGSLAVLRARPHAPTIETVNDYDALLANVYRAIQWDPEAVARWADWPVNEADMHARHKWLVKRKAYIRARVMADPTFYDAKAAGWWIWGICAWIGSGWCTEAKPTGNKLPYCAQKQLGAGIHGKRLSARLPMLGGGGGEDDHACAHYGRGVHGKTLSHKLPMLQGGRGGDDPQAQHGKGVHCASTRTRLYDVFAAISLRLRHTRVTCGDAMRVLSDAVTWRHGITGVFLDPPYPGDAGSTSGIYTNAKSERATFNDAFRYCIENGAHKSLRIAFCFYDGTLVDGKNVSDELCSLGWDVVPWKAGGGYGGQKKDGSENAARERVAFSPHCQRTAQTSLFA
jgi:DNA adenine methylase